MAALGINTVRIYTPPRRELLDEAARHGLRVMVGLPWSQHVAFLDDRALTRSDPARDRRRRCGELGDHPAVLMFALGNEIPPGVVRWHGRLRVERFLRGLYDEAKAASPGQPVHLRQLSADRISRPVVLRRLRLQRLPAPRAGPARLSGAAAAHRRAQAAAARRSGRRQHPRRRRGPGARSPRCTSAPRSKKAPAARSPSPGPTSGGAADIDGRRLGVRPGRSRAPAEAGGARPSPRRSPTRRFRETASSTWPRVSVVVCAYNAADTLDDCLALARAADLSRLRDHRRQRRLARSAPARSRRQHPRVRVIDMPNGGLSAARNVGLAARHRRDRRLHRRRHPRRSATG